MRKVSEWLEGLGLGQYAAVFTDNAIDWEVLPELTDQDLRELGVSALGHRKKLLKAIAALATEDDSAATTEPQADAEPPVAERRQLTVMFCDLVGSTALSERFDPEDLGDIIRGYQDCCAGVITRFDGYIARYMGDGILIYFGFPRAHEDDAERALRAGLGIIEAVARLEPRPKLSMQVRIGVATGLVVVGDIIGDGTSQEQMVVGETPNLAARLQSIAEPNSLVIAPSTRQLVGEMFEYTDLGSHQLKGFSNPVLAWRVIAAKAVGERFEATHSTGLTLLVGREQELALLRERWGLAKDGDGQVVLISGEPGIGKSRLVEALYERVTGEEGMIRMAFRCSPYNTNSALYPVLAHLERVLQLRREDTPETKLAKLEQVLGTYRFSGLDTVPLFAALLALPLPARYPSLRLTPEQQQKQQTQAALLAWLLEEAERQPVLAVWEDLHWADPSSLELLGLIIDQASTARMLTLLAYRPEFQPPWDTRRYLTLITLTRLRTAQIERIVAGVTKGKALPVELLEQIVAKTDGVPLFVEEMTKTILESGVLREAEVRYELTEPMEAVPIPMTLQDSLMARLDRLGRAKGLAQVGAAIGRQFSYQLLRAVTSHDEVAVQRELEQLVEAELLYQRGLPPHDTTYLFKHALIQDIAYQSLLRQRRQALHGAIGRAIEALEGEVGEEQTAILTYHYARSAHRDKAISYAMLAGEHAVRLHARAEARSYYQQALSIAQALPAAPEAQRAQIDAMLKLASVETTREDMERDQGNLEQARTLAEGLCVLEPADLQQAEHAIREAIRIQQELAAKPELARSYVSYARLLQRQGEPDKAEAYRAQAVGMFQQMGMSWDLAQAEQALET